MTDGAGLDIDNLQDVVFIIEIDSEIVAFHGYRIMWENASQASVLDRFWMEIRFRIGEALLKLVGVWLEHDGAGQWDDNALDGDHAIIADTQLLEDLQGHPAIALYP